MSQCFLSLKIVAGRVDDGPRHRVGHGWTMRSLTSVYPSLLRPVLERDVELLWEQLKPLIVEDLMSQVEAARGEPIRFEDCVAPEDPL